MSLERPESNWQNSGMDGLYRMDGTVTTQSLKRFATAP